MVRNYTKAVYVAVLALVLACVAVLLVGCTSTSSVGASNSLKVGVLTDVAGMSEYNEENNKYYGMEVDLAQEMATRAGYSKAEFVGISTDNGTELLEKGEIDALAACFSITDEREKKYSFSESYYTDRLVLMVQNSSLFTQTDQLKGGTIGTLAGANTSETLLELLKDRGFTNGEVTAENAEGTDIQYDTWHLKEYESLEDLSNALEAGEIDALAIDGAIANTYRTSERSFIKDFKSEEQQYAVATMKDSEQSSKINDAITSMIEDGTVEALTEKWS